MVRSDPTRIPITVKPTNVSILDRFLPIRRNAALVAARAVIATGIAIKCACRSAKRNVKKGNSVISCPNESGAIILELLQKSNCPKAAS